MAHALSRRDLDFLLYEWLDVESLTSRERFAEHSRETFDAVLDLTADLADKHFTPHNRKGDAEEPHMLPDGAVQTIPEVKTALAAYGESGLITGTFDEEVGGMQLPTVVARASMAWLQASNAGTSSYALLTSANAALLAEYGTPEQIETFVKPMLEGRWFGTMCLSEPQAGSSLADVTTRAEKQDDGTYRVVGSKMWISGGDQDISENIVHLVLAKTPGGEPGVKSISLMIVPKFLPNGERNDITLTGLNHKMGNRGTTNAALAIGDGTHTPGGRAGAVGYLVGEEHKGLSYMFHMMNEARIGVGFLATALGYVGYLKAVEYAADRTQGRPLGAKDPSAPPVAIIEHPDVRRMLLAQKAYVEGGLALGLYCSKLVDDQAVADDTAEAADLGLLLDVLTPIAKSWPSQWCLKANDLAIQVHGGYGYTRDYDVEQHYRDNRLNPIHEGTHGVQALDLLGRKVIMKGGKGLALLTARIAATVAAARTTGGDAAAYADQLDAAWTRVVGVTGTLWADADPVAALSNATAYLEAFGHGVVAWLWLEQYLAADGRVGDFYDGKRMATRYFFTHELPQIGPWIDLLASRDTTTLDMNPAWF
ncbi:acyl-CoA dehydrogenase [Gordonia spumicola]|uniref:Acyl-CoA dehydrogenase n=1 Tax=Gordonia spumicola TaxID=589161 RepID=A0A7I9VD55_9ACTN|nr:acyl-CoA dehydrogenase [Gordonia spumicola]GEE02930.1 acyl-CoA dehydrogenase [Gordonia spumicola]